MKSMRAIGYAASSGVTAFASRYRKALGKAASLRQVAAFLIHWLLVRVQDGPLKTASRLADRDRTPSPLGMDSHQKGVLGASRLRIARCQSCSSVDSRPLRHARLHHAPSPGWPTTGRGLFAPGRLTSSLAPCGVLMYASVARCGGARPGTKISAAGEYESALRGLLVTETTSHDASQPICRQQKKMGTVGDPTVPT